MPHDSPKKVEWITVSLHSGNGRALIRADNVIGASRGASVIGPGGEIVRVQAVIYMREPYRSPDNEPSWSVGVDNTLDEIERMLRGLD